MKINESAEEQIERERDLCIQLTPNSFKINQMRNLLVHLPEDQERWRRQV